MLKIYKENKCGDEDLYLRLEDSGDGDIDLVVCDYQGNRHNGGTLLYIEKDTKRVIACQFINKDLGFKLNSGHKLVIE